MVVDKIRRLYASVPVGDSPQPPEDLRTRIELLAERNVMLTPRLAALGDTQLSQAFEEFTKHVNTLMKTLSERDKDGANAEMAELVVCAKTLHQMIARQVY